MQLFVQLLNQCVQKEASAIFANSDNKSQKLGQIMDHIHSPHSPPFLDFIFKSLKKRLELRVKISQISAISKAKKAAIH